MTGTKLYQKKSQTCFFVSLYGLLALLGCVQAALSIRGNRSVSGAAGFMVVFGIGMAVLALLKSRRPQVSVYEDFLEVSQGSTVSTVRYRAVVAVARPDKKRLVVTLREDGGMKNVVVWLKELDPVDVGKLHDFLTDMKGKKPGAPRQA